MYKRGFLPFLIVILLTFIYFTIRGNSTLTESVPVVLEESASLRELSIDEKINESQIIIIGSLETRLQSKWVLQYQKDPEDATPQEVLDAGGLFTDFVISINRILKGNFDEKFIRVRSFIGETELIRWEDSSQLVYKEDHLYLLFLSKDTGPTASVDPGNYRSVNADTAIYEIVGDRAISSDDEWLLEDLIAYIEKSLSAETLIEVPTSAP